MDPPVVRQEAPPSTIPEGARFQREKQPPQNHLKETSKEINTHRGRNII